MIFDGVVHKNFHGSEVAKEDMHCICLTVMNIHSSMKMYKRHYPQVYLEECKYVDKSDSE